MRWMRRGKRADRGGGTLALLRGVEGAHGRRRTLVPPGALGGGRVIGRAQRGTCEGSRAALVLLDRGLGDDAHATEERLAGGGEVSAGGGRRVVVLKVDGRERGALHRRDGEAGGVCSSDLGCGQGSPPRWRRTAGRRGAWLLRRSARLVVLVVAVCMSYAIARPI